MVSEPPKPVDPRAWLKAAHERLGEPHQCPSVVDHFPVAAAGELSHAHDVVTELIRQLPPGSQPPTLFSDLGGFPAGVRLLESTPEARRDVAIALVERIAWLSPIVRVFNEPFAGARLDFDELMRDWGHLLGADTRAHIVLRPEGSRRPFWFGHALGARRAVVLDWSRQLLRRDLPFTASRVLRLVHALRIDHLSAVGDPVAAVVSTVERFAARDGVGDELRGALDEVRVALGKTHSDAEQRRLIARVDALLGTLSLPIEAGEAWSDAALAELAGVTGASRDAWRELIVHVPSSAVAKPSDKWLDRARELLTAVGEADFAARVVRWFPLVDQPRTEPRERRWSGDPDPNMRITEVNAGTLRGLVWYASLISDRALARAIATLGVSAFRKIPQLGPRCPKVGNACIYALGHMPGLDGVIELGVLGTRVKTASGRKEIDKALASAAGRLGLTPDDLEELAVPTFDLGADGSKATLLAGFTAELRVSGPRAEIRWASPDGKPLKSVPARVRAEARAELKDLTECAKDIERLTPAISARLEQSYLREWSWPFDVWRERYLAHPLVATVARRLVWVVQSGDESRGAFVRDGGWCDASDQPLHFPPADARVRLWHPLDGTRDEAHAWRAFVERHEVRQPFKQAHREIYRLTDAERETRLYSNRFAAHILRQHQFSALCAARGWRNALRLMVDQDFPPAQLELPNHGIRAEFWVEGAGDQYGIDSNDTGTYLRVATDQVRFYPIRAAENRAHASQRGYRSAGLDAPENRPVPLADIPERVFSEVMRDVDLFVGVASVGNDPTWSDGGPGGRYRDYWQGFSFGALSATAATRKAVLEEIVPRLKIADRCRIDDRFLVVRGDLRTYWIHLGSGNVLMEPGHEYLCIVPSSRSTEGDVFLPFEGDAMSSIVLSKALLLASDTKIRDETILRQIRR